MVHSQLLVPSFIIFGFCDLNLFCLSCSSPKVHLHVLSSSSFFHTPPPPPPPPPLPLRCSSRPTMWCWSWTGIPSATTAACGCAARELVALDFLVTHKPRGEPSFFQILRAGRRRTVTAVLHPATAAAARVQLRLRAGVRTCI